MRNTFDEHIEESGGAYWDGCHFIASKIDVSEERSEDYYSLVNANGSNVFSFTPQKRIRLEDKTPKTISKKRKRLTTRNSRQR